MIGWGYMTEALIPVSGFPLSELNVCRLGRDAVLDLSSISAEDEAEEGEDQDDDDDEAAAVGPAAIDTDLPLIVEFAVGAHGGKRKTRRAAGFGLLARGRLAIVDAFLFRGL